MLRFKLNSLFVLIEGAWDYFRKGYIKRKDIKCHTLKLSKERFIRETYPTFNIDKNTLSTKKCENALNNFWDVAKEGLNGPQKLTGALNNLYGALCKILVHI